MTAVIAASPAAHVGKTYWLTGPDLFSYSDVAPVLSSAYVLLPSPAMEGAVDRRRSRQRGHAALRRRGEAAGTDILVGTAEGAATARAQFLGGGEVVYGRVDRIERRAGFFGRGAVDDGVDEPP